MLRLATGCSLDIVKGGGVVQVAKNHEIDAANQALEQLIAQAQAVRGSRTSGQEA